MISAIALCCSILGSAVRAEDFFAPMPAEDARSRVMQWVAEQGELAAAVTDAIGQIWSDVDETAAADIVFDKCIATFAVAHAETGRFVKSCHPADPALLPPALTLTTQDGADVFYKTNLDLFYARYLVRRRMFDEANSVFERIDFQQAVDPASGLFLKAVCQHQLLLKSDGLDTLHALLSNTEDVPVRYSSVAKLMQHDLQSLQDKSLDEIARRMADVERRLDLGRGGDNVQKHEQQIIDMLDELIKKLEQQAGGAGGGGGAGGNSNQPPTEGADDSSVKGSTAPGEVDPKKMEGRGAWGMLDPKQEHRAKQLINRSFPPHYQRAIEKYFRKLSTRRSAGRNRP